MRAIERRTVIKMAGAAAAALALVTPLSWGAPAGAQLRAPARASLAAGATAGLMGLCQPTVAQELLARNAEGRLAVELRQVHLLNGGLYPDLHRPEPVQTALLDPVQGPQVSAMMNADYLKAKFANRKSLSRA